MYVDIVDLDLFSLLFLRVLFVLSCLFPVTRMLSSPIFPCLGNCLRHNQLYLRKNMMSNCA